MRRGTGRIARRGRTGAAALVGLLALTGALALGAGCGSPQRTTQLGGTPVARDLIDSLAAEVESRYEAAASAGNESPDDASRQAVAAAAEELVRAVLASERPLIGWTPDGLAAALVERRVAAQAREIARGREPWIVLVSDPRQADVPYLALLAYPSTGAVAGLPLEPFLHPYQIAAWRDSLGPAVLLAGARRSPAGLQPAAWVLRLPAEPPAARGPTPAVPVAGEWGLAAAGPARLSFAAAAPDSAPHLLVRDSALPNPLFDECASCPHVEARLEYRYDGTQMQTVGRQLSHTPYAAFVGLVQALVQRDDPAARGYVDDPRVLDQARALGFDRLPTGGLWRIAPGSDAKSLDQVYLRGQEGAFRVLLAPGDTGFVVTSISPTTFSLD